VTSTCTDSNLLIESQLLTAQTSLAQAQAYGQSTVQEQADVDAAQLQNQQFGAMCVCMTATLSKLEPLTTPAPLASSPASSLSSPLMGCAVPWAAATASVSRQAKTR